MKNINSYLNKYKSIIFITILISIVAFLIRNIYESALTWGDISYVTKQSKEIIASNTFYIWSHSSLGTTLRMSLGSLLATIVLSIPFISDFQIYLILRVLPFFLIVIVSYFILYNLTKNYYVSFIVSLLSLINPVIFGDVLNGQTLWIYPIILYLLLLSIKIYYKYEINNKNTLLYSLFLFLALGFLPPIIVPLVITLVIFNLIGLLSIIKNKGILLKILKHSIIISILFLILSYPYISVVSSGQAAYSAPSTLQDYYHNYSKTGLINTLRLSGNAGNGQETLGYNDPALLNSLGYFYIIIIILGLIFRKNIKGVNENTKYFDSILFTILVLVGFTHLITVNRSIGEQLFENSWIVGTIRNPSKLFVIILQFIILGIALSLSNLKGVIISKWKINLISFSLFLILIIYSWPVLSGDLGLSISRPNETRKQTQLINWIINDSSLSKTRSIIIPSDHEDELRYETLSMSLNTLRLGGDYPLSQNLRAQIINSFNYQLDDFKKFTEIASIGRIYLKKGNNYVSNQFSLFPVRIEYNSAYNFLSKNFKKIEENKDYVVFENRGASAKIFSSDSISNLNEIKDLDDIMVVYKNPGDTVISDKDTFKFNFIKKYNIQNKITNSAQKDVKAILRNPEIVNIEIEITDKKNEKVITVYKNDFLKPDVRNKIIIVSTTTKDVNMIKISDSSFRLTNESIFTTLRAGEHTLEFIKLDNSQTSQNDVNFEKNIPYQTGNASISREGEPKIKSEIISITPGGNKLIQLESENHLIYFRTPLKNIKPTSLYYLEFTYKNNLGGGGQFSIWQNNLNEAAKQEQLKENKDWSIIGSSFSVKENSGPVDFYFYTDSRNGQLSRNLIDEIKLFEEKSEGGVNFIVDPYPKSTEYNPVMTIIPTDSDNLIKNGDFKINILESWDFGDASLGKIGSPGIEYSQVYDKDNALLELSSTNHIAYVSQKINNFDPNSSYEVSFNYKHAMGNPASFAIWQDSVNISKPSATLPVNQNEWGTSTIVFTPDPKAKNIYIYLYTGSTNNEKSLNYFDNVSVKKVSKISHYIIPENNNLYTQPTFTVKSFKKINPTLYEIEAYGNEGLLVFNESFHKDWNIYYIATSSEQKIEWYWPLISKKTKVDENTKHVIVNGYSNAWIVNNKINGSYKIILEFKPQKKFYITLFISWATFISCLGYLVVDFVRNRRSKVIKSKVGK
jgi:hypothetical protein